MFCEFLRFDNSSTPRYSRGALRHPPGQKFDLTQQLPKTTSRKTSIPARTSIQCFSYSVKGRYESSETTMLGGGFPHALEHMNAKWDRNSQLAVPSGKLEVEANRI